MNEQSQPRQDDQETQTRSFLPVAADQLAPTQQFPAVDYPTERFYEPELPAEQFYEPPPTAERPFKSRYASPHYSEQPYAEPQFADRTLAAPVEPFAHAGGLAHGNPPAAPYRPMDPYIPQHLHAPQPLAYGQSYGQFPQPFGYPTQMQQTVFVNGGGRGDRRVNQALHLILSVVTFGLWLPVWVILTIANS